MFSSVLFISNSASSGSWACNAATTLATGSPTSRRNKLCRTSGVAFWYFWAFKKAMHNTVPRGTQTPNGFLCTRPMSCTRPDRLGIGSTKTTMLARLVTTPSINVPHDACRNPSPKRASQRRTLAVVGPVSSSIRVQNFGHMERQHERLTACNRIRSTSISGARPIRLAIVCTQRPSLVGFGVHFMGRTMASIYSAEPVITPASQCNTTRWSNQLALKCTYVDVHNDDETTQTVAYERRLRDLRLRMFSGIRSSCSSAGGVLCFSAAPHAPRRLTLQILPAQTSSPMFACHRRQAAARRHRR